MTSTGQMRFKTDTGIGVAAMPSFNRGSPAYSMLPEPAMPISPLLMSHWVSSTRRPSVSKRRRMAMRLKIAGSSPFSPASRIVPPLNPSCQLGILPFGGSRCASKVMRLAPELT